MEYFEESEQEQKVSQTLADILSRQSHTQQSFYYPLGFFLQGLLIAVL